MNLSISTYSGRSPATLSAIYRPILLVCAVALFTIVTLSVTAGLISWDFLWFLFASALFMTCLCVARPLSGTARVASEQSFLTSTLVIWVFLMISEGIFVHASDTNRAVGGNFGASAFFEAASWILSFAALAFVTCFRPEYLRRVLTGPPRWATLFAIIAVASCPFSPVLVYSLAMAFKLCIIVAALLAISRSIDGITGIEKLFSALFAGTLILTLAGFVTPFLGSAPVFAGDRFGAVIGLSGNAGLLLLLSVLYFILKKNPWFLLLVGFSLVLMMLVGGKGGIAASLISFLAFFAFLKNARQAVAACFGLAIVFALCVAFTPFGHNLQLYGESGNASTLSGRTQLWTDVWPEIAKHPVVGHGYRASRFVSAEVEGAFAEAGHIHNAFLEVLYNNGVVGLTPILIMNVVIVFNLGHVLRRSLPPRERYFAAAALALYLHLLVWGMTAPTFGGTPDNRFMTFFALLVISIHLRAHVNRETSNTE